jgi:hypothetical protein
VNRRILLTAVVGASLFLLATMLPRGKRDSSAVEDTANLHLEASRSLNSQSIGSGTTEMPAKAAPSPTEISKEGSDSAPGQEDRYDPETIAKLNALILAFIQKSSDIGSLTADLGNLGFEVTTEIAGNSTLGESMELRAKSEDKGLHTLLMSFDILEEKKLDLSRIEMAVYPSEKVYVDVVGQLQQSLGEGSIGVNSSAKYRSWTLGDRHLWIDQYDSKDPYDPNFKDMIVLTYEPDIEGVDHPH